jgi:hypothetical protein
MVTKLKISGTSYTEAANNNEIYHIEYPQNMGDSSPETK